MAECGSCTLCCKLLGITELDKPRNAWCKSCSPGKGCNIYADRPPSCVDFECGWLANDGDPELRPDRIHLIIAGESTKINAYVVHVDPMYPDAAERPRAKRMLRAMMTHGRHPNVVLVTGDRRRFIGNDPGTVARLLDVAERAGVPLT